MKGKGGDGRELDKTDNQRVGGIAANRLRSFVERIERLEEEKRELSDDIKEIKSEAKAAGFDAKVINFIIRERRKDPDDVEEFNDLVDTYKHALGMKRQQEEESL